MSSVPLEANKWQETRKGNWQVDGGEEATFKHTSCRFLFQGYNYKHFVQIREQRNLKAACSSHPWLCNLLSRKLLFSYVLVKRQRQCIIVRLRLKE